ncbi:uncharacterized protein LOC106181297 isoform X2 [Lingula anatina]|uniref:Uncharacterized protein LOC106181297 isoform X2 n=1 Tax=Lingula anatina TaxID=7574 RepID=A0A1S3KEN2_LINAN|nr:uncharacterized protein LOC106181297 isoform X2 [Lingula anatina]|eukprot:XP_013421083.1 uncharacterized protein LOC106181297 isoform X2 [Lingula anatina]
MTMLAPLAALFVFTCTLACFAHGTDVPVGAFHIRSKRSPTKYGNWCGLKTTGIGLDCCTCANTIEECRACLPPKDQLDEMCLRHDMCLCDQPPSNVLHKCYCEREVYNNIKGSSVCRQYSGWKNLLKRAQCSTYAASMVALFGGLPCWCDSKQKYVPNFSSC